MNSGFVKAAFIATIAVLAAPSARVGFVRAEPPRLSSSQSEPPSLQAAPPVGARAPSAETSPARNPDSSVPAEHSEATLEIPLPEVFRGCWAAEVKSLDSVETVSHWRGGMPEWVIRGTWNNKVYTFCYSQIGSEMALRFARAESIDRFGQPGHAVPGFYEDGVTYQTKAVSSDGPNSATIRVTMSSVRHTWLGSYYDDSVTTMGGSIDPDGVMRVSATVEETPAPGWAGWQAPGWRVGWHAEFHQTSAP